MASTRVFEDQENVLPGNQNRAKPQDPRLVLGSRRPVLGAINTNLRKQPVRAAKQGVGYESGIPQKDENLSQSISSQPSFLIHEDSSSSISSSRSSSSLSIPSDSLLKERLTTEATENIEIDPAITCLQTTSLSARPTPVDAMDMSVCEEDMQVEPPREDVLSSRIDDIFDVPEYAADIYQYLREAEVCHKPRPNYMSKQTDITSSMRWILVDWLVEVAEEYSLHTETLYLAVSYIDRFLSQMSVKRDKLQLVGTTAMFIAAKYEEIYPPDVGQFAYITDNTYKVNQILRMEHLILKVLSFDMAVPTAHVFVNKFCKELKCKDEITHLALFLAEMTMLDCDPFLRFLPSTIAAASVALDNHTMGLPAWPAELEETSGFSLEQLKECYVNLQRVFSRAQEPQQHAIRDKYKAKKWSSVSKLSPLNSFPW